MGLTAKIFLCKMVIMSMCFIVQYKSDLVGEEVRMTKTRPFTSLKEGIL